MTEAGGPSGDSIEKGYLDPFTEKSGVAVVRENPSGLGKLRAMVEAGAVTSVVLELSSPELEQAKALDLVEPLDWDAIEPMPMFDEAKDEKGYGYQFYSTIMAWREDAKAPQSWQDFWDVEAFPGKRALPDYAAYILPMALLADGVPVEELYPLDLDRAFASLERIKDHVAVWWQAGAQPPQLLKDNEVQYAVAWSGRVAGQEGIEFTFEDGQLDLAYFVVPKGADAEPEAARQRHLLRDERAGEPGGRRRRGLLHRQQPGPRAAAAQGPHRAVPDHHGQQGGAVPLRRQVVVRQRRGGRDPLAGVQARPVSERPALAREEAGRGPA